MRSGSRLRDGGLNRVPLKVGFFVTLVLAAVCAGCPSSTPVQSPSPPPPSGPLFPTIAPIADANPAIRHPIAVRVPTRMEIVRHGDSVSVSFPELQTTNLMVGYKMVTGIIREDCLYREDVAHPRGMSLQDGLTFGTEPIVLTPGRDGVPAAGQQFAFEQRVTIFETDLPAQHMWSPQSGKHYRVLWTRAFSLEVR